MKFSKITIFLGVYVTRPSLETKFVFKNGNILLDKSEYLVNPVNVVRVMSVSKF